MYDSGEYVAASAVGTERIAAEADAFHQLIFAVYHIALLGAGVDKAAPVAIHVALAAVVMTPCVHVAGFADCHKVKIHAASAKNVVTLPVEVVNIGKEGSFCYVIEDGLVTKRNITTGISSEDYVEITDGIKEGEEVIADLGDYTEGMEVQAVPEQTGEDADE